jgi:hypothetical protein
MITVQEVVSDPDFTAPEPWTILRSTDAWVLGGVQSTTAPITMIGPVQQSSNKEIAMVPEADRVGSLRSFWSTIPIYVTRGSAPVPSTHGEVPAPVGRFPATALTLSVAPPGGQVALTKNGGLLVAGTDYAVAGAVVQLAVAAVATDTFWVSWSAVSNTQAANSDILVWDGNQYRVLQVYNDPGSMYWKAIATRMRAA